MVSHYKGKFVTDGQRKYRLIKLVGSGGSGQVWRAQEQGTAQQYAVKFLTYENRDKVSRFEKEISFLKLQEHPNIIKIVGHGTGVNDKKFYVMPLYQKTLLYVNI